MNGLLIRIQNNDEEAFEKIYDSFHQRAYALALRYTRNPVIAKELTQQFFIKVWEKRHKLTNQKPLEGQLFVILRNLVIDEMRKMARRKTLAQEVAAEVEPYTSITEESILHNDLKEQLKAAVESLPPRRKKIFELSREQGLSYREIAEQLAISQKTVEAQMTQALKTLRVKLSSFLHLFF